MGHLLCARRGASPVGTASPEKDLLELTQSPARLAPTRFPDQIKRAAAATPAR